MQAASIDTLTKVRMRKRPGAKPTTSGFLRVLKPRSTLVRLAYFSSQAGVPQIGYW